MKCLSICFPCRLPAGRRQEQDIFPLRVLPRVCSAAAQPWAQGGSCRSPRGLGMAVTVAWEWKITEGSVQLPHYRTKALLSKVVIWCCSTPPDIKSFHFVPRNPHCPLQLTKVSLSSHVSKDKKICFQGLVKNILQNKT